ncbi:putative adenylyltransferase/sulfurtransferase MoeZ [compost metagenome]
MKLIKLKNVTLYKERVNLSYLRQGISHIDSDELYNLLQDDNATSLIIDVREPHEYEQAHIPGIPLIPMGNIPLYVDLLDKSQEYIFICRSGQRSFEVANYLQQHGFQQVHNFDGGMLSWMHETRSGLEHVITDLDGDASKLKRKK